MEVGRLRAIAVPGRLQWGHGREAMDGGHATRLPLNPMPCFNGAMAVRPWMVAYGAEDRPTLIELQWGHGREAMDGPASRATGTTHGSFNGAMAVRPWMAERPPFGSGLEIRFNGAMAVRPWMVRPRSRSASPRSSFNGAMAVRPWMGRRRRSGRPR